MTGEKKQFTSTEENMNHKIENLSSEKTTQVEEKKKQKNIFKVIAIGNSTGQAFVVNFFAAFAATVGVTSSQMGFLTSIRNLISSLFQGSIGRLSDKFGRKYILLSGFVFIFIATIAIIFAYNPIWLIIISIIQAFSLSIIIPVWNATLGDVTKIRERASFIGKLTSMGTGTSVTLMLSLAIFFYLLYNKYHGMVVINGWGYTLTWQYQYGIAYGFASIFFLVSIIGVLCLKETKQVQKGNKPPRMFIALKNNIFRRYFIVNSVYGLIMAALWPIFPIVQIKILEMTFPQIAIINAVFAGTASFAQFFGGRLGDRIGRKPIILLSRFFMFAIPIPPLIALFTGNWLYLLFSNVLGGLGTGFMNVSQNAYVLDVAPEDQMGTYSGLIQVGWGIATFFGSILTGFLADSLERNYGLEKMALILLIAFSILRLLASLGYFFIKESYHKEEKAIETISHQQNQPPTLSSTGKDSLK